MLTLSRTNEAASNHSKAVVVTLSCNQRDPPDFHMATPQAAVIRMCCSHSAAPNEAIKSVSIKLCRTTWITSRAIFSCRKHNGEPALGCEPGSEPESSFGHIQLHPSNRRHLLYQAVQQVKTQLQADFQLRRPNRNG